jgi:hypothetical protein
MQDIREETDNRPPKITPDPKVPKGNITKLQVTRPCVVIRRWLKTESHVAPESTMAPPKREVENAL